MHIYLAVSQSAAWDIVYMIIVTNTHVRSKIRSEKTQWRIYIQKFPADPPTGPNSFVLTCFHQKVPVSEVGTPSNEGWPPPNGKSWIRP